MCIRDRSIEPIIDMGRTAVNVTGQSVVATIVAKRSGIWSKQTFEAGADGEVEHSPTMAEVAPQAVRA